MRAFNLQGPEFRVTVLKSTVYNFGISRQYTGLSYKRGLSFVFDKRTGALVRHTANKDAEPEAVLALEVLARTYGAQKLGLTFFAPSKPAESARRVKRRARRKAKKARDVARHNDLRAFYKKRDYERACRRAENADKATTEPLPGTRAERRKARKTA